jgi:hypothetical protein
MLVYTEEVGTAVPAMQSGNVNTGTETLKRFAKMNAEVFGKEGRGTGKQSSLSTAGNANAAANLSTPFSPWNTKTEMVGRIAVGVKLSVLTWTSFGNVFQKINMGCYA